MDKNIELDIVKKLRDETGLGMMELNSAFNTFINALKCKPRHKTDVVCKLECRWKEFDLRNPQKPGKNEVKGLEELLKEERSMFNSYEEYLAWVNEECRGIAKEKNLELEPRFFNKLVRK